RVDGRVVIAGMVGIGLVFVVLNLFFAHGSTTARSFGRPSSRPVRTGVTYRVRILTSCEAVIDFDGAFWMPRMNRPLRPPVDPASARLLDANTVVLRLASGERFVMAR